MTHRRTLLAAALATPAIAQAQQAYPARPIRIVIPYAPGGGTDIVVRAIAGEMQAGLGQPLIVENRPGAASAIGTDLVAKSPADGYTLTASDSAFVINPGLLGTRLPYDTLRDFVGVTMMASGPVVLLVHPSLPVRTLAEFIAHARANPGRIGYGSGGNGSGPHLAGVLLSQAAGIELLHVPYRGTAPALNDLLGGQVKMMFGGISSGRVHVDSGALHALAVTGAARAPALPNVPTFAEHGLDVDADSYWGIYAPTGTPDAVRETISRHAAQALRSDALRERLIGLGYVVIANTPAEHDAQFRRMVARWREVITRANVTPD